MLILLMTTTVVLSLAVHETNAVNSPLPPNSFSADVDGSTNVNLCGYQLAQLLSLVCNGIYHTPDNGVQTVFTQVKKSSGDFSTVNEPDHMWPAMLFEPYPRFRSSRNGRLHGTNGLLASLRRNKREVFIRRARGLASECCQNSCSINHMRQYCGVLPPVQVTN